MIEENVDPIIIRKSRNIFEFRDGHIRVKKYLNTPLKYKILFRLLFLSVKIQGENSPVI